MCAIIIHFIFRSDTSLNHAVNRVMAQHQQKQQSERKYLDNQTRKKFSSHYQSHDDDYTRNCPHSFTFRDSFMWTFFISLFPQFQIHLNKWNFSNSGWSRFRKTHLQSHTELRTIRGYHIASLSKMRDEVFILDEMGYSADYYYTTFLLYERIRIQFFYLFIFKL